MSIRHPQSSDVPENVPHSKQAEDSGGLLIRRRELLCLGATGAVALLPTGCSSPSENVEQNSAAVPADTSPPNVEPNASASTSESAPPTTSTAPPSVETSPPPATSTPPTASTPPTQSAAAEPQPLGPYDPAETSDPVTTAPTDTAPTAEPTATATTQPTVDVPDEPEPEPIAEPEAAAPDAGAPAAPDFDEVASCVLTPTDRAGEGPFFIHDDEVMDDPSLFRSDIRDGREGVQFDIHLRVLEQSAECATPIAGVEVYVWHTDALGFYSGFNDQNPDQSYMGGPEREVENADRFCRGAGVTDANGVVSFKSLYPGWYNGRAIHVHFVCLRPGSGPGTASYRGADYHVFTTQFYFDEAFSRDIHENNVPYNTRLGGNYETYVRPESDVRPTLTKVGNGVVGALNIITVASESRGGSTGGGFGGF